MGKVLETKTRFLQEDADSFDYVLLGGLLGAKSYSILYLSLLVLSCLVCLVLSCLVLFL